MNAHFECGRAIREQLAGVPTGLTKHQLYDAVDFHRKGEAVFGACLSAMLQAGDLAEIREPMQLTRYTLKGNAPQTTIAMQRSAERQHDAEEYRGRQGLTEHQIRERMKNADVASMRQQIVDVVARATAPILTDEIAAALPDITKKRVREYTQVLRRKGLLQSRTTYARAGNVHTHWWPASKPWPGEPEAPAAAPASASAPSATPAQGAADLADWQAMEKALDEAYRQADTARFAYIKSCTNEHVLGHMERAVELSKEALHIHRQRRPA